ncbi:MAG: T9SS type A sorting domain-containing protein [Bacteroidia bacterium]|nr:T9SS type A sorting domain-containing protein [Bacteroidia bacterium]
MSFQANHSNANAIYTWKLNGNIVGANSPTYTKTAAIMDSAISVTISSQCFVETGAWKFKVNQKDTIHISSTTCGVKVGNKNYYVSGSYSDTFVNRFGCDSIVYLNLSVNNSQFNNLSANLIRYWTMNKQDSVRDIISNQTLLTHPSLPYTVDRFGMSNAALNIAAGNHVFRPTVALPASNITISFWYYYVSGYTNTRSLLSNNLTNNAGYYLYIDPNGIIKGNNAAGANFSGTGTLTTNKWYHFTYTLSSAGVAQIFLNGNLQLTINSVSLSGITRIGNGITNNNNTPGIGSYDDIRVYNTVLSANDIRNLPMRPSIYELPSKKAFCKGDSGIFKIGLNQQVSTQIQSYRNGVLFGSDSTLTINNMATTDSLVSFKIYSQCAYEEYKFPFIVNPTSAIVNDSFCGSYSYNGKTYTNPGTYFDTTLNANGCNFITQLNLSNSGSIEANAGLIRYWTGNIAGGQISLIGNDTITPVGSLQVTGWPGRAGNANGSFFNGLINNTYLKTNLPIMSTYTISFWYKMEVNGYGRQLNLIASNSTTATGSIILAKTGSNSIYVFTSAGATIGNGFSIGANEWNHITLVRNGNNFSFYANGNLISSGNTINTANPDNIGNNGVNNNGNSAIGWYDDIKVYETAVSANQAKAIYKSPSLLSMPDLSNYCIGTNAPFAFQFQKDSISSFQFLRNGVVVSNDTSFNFNPLLSTDTLIGYRIIRSCEIETINIKLKNQGTNLNDGMIRYWTLNVEDNRRDLVTNQSVGFIGTFTQATGRTGKANAALNVASLGNLFYPNTAIPSTNVSVSLWYQRTSASYFGARTIVSNNQANGNIAKYLYVDPSGWLICGTNTANGGVNTNQNITTGLWYHLVYHISSTGTVKVYVNGVLKFTQTGVPVHPITYFGNRPDGNEPGVGNYDDVKIYNRELSAVEVSKLYAMPSLLSHPLNVSACQGSSLLLTYHFANVAGRSFSFSKNGTVLSTDSFLRINSLNLTDTLYNMTLNTNCGIENYSIKITVNPAGGVGPTLTYTKATSRITASSTFNGFKLFRNGVAVDSSSTTGNINYLSTKCGNYFAQYFNNGSAACPSVSPTLTISLDTVIVNASLCSGKAYVFGSQSLTAAGTYYRTVLSSLACDSTIRLNLSLKQTSSSVITRSGCGLISIFGKVYSQTGQYEDTLINAAGCDSLVTLNLTVFSGTPSVSNVSADVCKQFVYRNKTYTQTGIYRDTLFGASATGCDSIIVLNLTIQQINRGINKAGNTLTSLETGANYVWYNCTTNSLIANQTNSSYTPTVSGNYAAIITKNNCTDTSFCTQILINNCNIGITYTVLNPQDSIACKSLRVAISGATLPIFTNVSWTNNPTGVDIQITDSVHVYNDLCPETYLLRITDATGCKDSINFTINQPSVGLQGYGVSNINIYPNPAQEVVFVDGLRVGSNLILRDLNGKELIATKATEENILMPCSQLAEGVYILLIQEGENTITRKLIITR